MVKRLFWLVTLAILVAVGIALSPSRVSVVYAAITDSGRYPSSGTPSTSEEALSPYWRSAIQQWAPLIARHAERHDLDPDFLAALIWIESRGNPRADGPAGAVGLMQVMPRESGFSWRPTREALLDPNTNLAWGSGVLSAVLRQGEGDVFSALAAYNGGWSRIAHSGPRALATRVLREYAYSVASHNGLENQWVAYFAVVDLGVRGPIHSVHSDHRDFQFHGDANAAADGRLLIPDVPSTRMLARVQDDASDLDLSIGLWLYSVTDNRWMSEAGSTALSDPSANDALDDVAGAHRPASTPSIMAGSSPPKWFRNGHGGESAPEAVGPTPDNSATSLACSPAPLRVDAYPLERINTPEGWLVRIYARAYHGNCSYTYAWNSESNVQGAGYAGPIVFEVTSPRRDSVLVGTVVVISGEETERVGLYIHPPD